MTIVPLVPADSKQFVRTFLQSIARPRDAELYLGLFQKLPKASFAVIGAESAVIERALGLVVEPVRFLRQLGLYPILAVNLFDRSAQPAATQLLAGLHQAGVSADRFAAEHPALSEQVTRSLKANTVAVVDFANLPDPFTRLQELTIALQSRKLMLLRSAGGLGPKERGLLRITDTHQLLLGERGISVLNLRADYAPLLEGESLSADERDILRHVKTLHDAYPSLQTSITSPLHMLGELFSVRGTGTFIKTGNNIQRWASFGDLDAARLRQLLDDTFGRKVKPEFFEAETSSIYLEGDYRAVAILLAGHAPGGGCPAPKFLTKFAVGRTAQGEGVGRDLWEEVIREHPSLYWRARVNNPVAPWYASQCDGMQREGDWQVFWRGVSTNDIPAFVRDALNRPHDFDEAPMTLEVNS